MVTEKNNSITSLLFDDITLRTVAPNIISVFPTNATGNEYDNHFGKLYDMVACNPIYNGLIWGYSVNFYKEFTEEAIYSTPNGVVLDLACGSLAFTAAVYGQEDSNRRIICSDQSLKMLKMATARLQKQKNAGVTPCFFLHADALHLPFKDHSITTIIAENLLHCLADPTPFLERVRTILTSQGRAYFTTLISTDRWADRYLKVLAHQGKLIARTKHEVQHLCTQAGLRATCETKGNLLAIRCECTEQTENHCPLNHTL